LRTEFLSKRGTDGGARNFYLQRKRLIQENLLVVLFTLIAFLVMGYHPGFEDDAVYLTAVKADLNPALYPHDSAFFRLQMQASVFDGGMARFVRWTHVPLAWAELFWQMAALFMILWACRRIAALIFKETCAQWAAVAMVAAMFTLPVAGTALNIADQHLHPRNLSTALILMAAAWILEGKATRWRAIPLLLAAFLLHPIMAALGMSFCAFLTLALLEPAPFSVRAAQGSLASVAPLGWLFAPAGPSWRAALDSKAYYSIYRWTWYEWLGALAPLFLFWLLSRAATKYGRAAHRPTITRLSRFALAVFLFGVFQQVFAMAIMTLPSLVRLTPLQPMRYLQLVYLFMALAAGGLLGRFVLASKVWRWAVYLVLINGGMFLVQWEEIDDGAHLELPGMASANPWVQAFDWVRLNTPADAYFALDPRYLAAPGEGYRNFRALAERSQLADAIKDTAVVTQVPSLAPLWQQQQLAQAGWAHFQLGDFERLKHQFGVDWVLVSYPQPAGLDCRWHDDALAVCRVP
jgi:hypothetical protein